jgi:N-acetyl-1-D-myo-inositol-2-amino-2-deoxy-alpha-D-glucopyranoside deacetylase
VPSSPQRVLFVHAHPGDASRDTGTSIRTLVARGGDAVVLVATGDDELPGARVLRLGAAGARWADRSPRSYDTLAGADLDELAADVAAAIVLEQPDAVVAPRADADPDRIRLREAVEAAADVLVKPLYAPGGTAGPGSVVLEGEVLSRVGRDRDASERVSRASAVGTAVVAALVGALAGLVLTAVHQASTAGVPWGIVAAVGIAAALITGLRLVFDSRVPALCAALALLAVSFWLSLQPTGGSVLVPANPAGYAWTYGPLAVAVIVLAWPRRLPRPGDRLVVPAPKGPDRP